MPYRRRRLCKTNYKKRLLLLKSGKPRLVVRKTNTKLIAQIVKYEHDGDVVVTSASSADLVKLGWKGATKNIPAAYLTGLLIAKKAKEAKIKDVVLDIGLHTPVKGSRVFAVAKGAFDGGLNLPMSETIVPDESRLKGEHLKNKADIAQVLAKVK